MTWRAVPVAAQRCVRALRRWVLGVFGVFGVCGARGMHWVRSVRGVRSVLWCGSTLLAAGCAMHQPPAAPSSSLSSGLPSPPLSSQSSPQSSPQSSQLGVLTGAFTVEGRISVNYGTQNVSGKVQWAHDAVRDDIALASPLGTQVARLVRDSAGVALIDSEQVTHRASDAESLTQQRLGWRLPLTGLTAWVRGRTHGAMPDEVRRDERGRIAFLAEDGWGIEYAYPADGSGGSEAGIGASTGAVTSASALPRRLFMRYARAAEPLEIRLVIDQWSVP